MTNVQEFTIEIADDDIADLKARLAATRWPDPETPADWSQGVPLNYLQEVVNYWLNDYDFHRLAKRLNTFDNFKTEILGLDIHFLHIRSSNAEAQPLIMTHGWPGSVVEFLNVIDPLTEPQRYGGNAEDAFHLVLPSLPGYGFSGKPTSTGWGIEKIADAWAELMTQLGYRTYFAQGGDWGSVVTSALARQHAKSCLGIHLNMVVVPPDAAAEALTEIEKSALAGWQFYQDWDSGYSKQQATRPQTLGYGLVDSPVGQAAWILEKFYAWTDCNGHPENAISRDEMLDDIMVYWLNAAGASSARLYWQSFGDATAAATPITVPMGATIFPKEIFRTSKRFAAKIYKNIVHWSNKDTGGHFAAFEQPEVFVQEVQTCFRGLR
jgi:pimeloyl-ACP methyl ester carboxylesterase